MSEDYSKSYLFSLVPNEHIINRMCVTHLDHDVVTGSCLLCLVHPALHHVVAHLNHVLQTHRNHKTHYPQSNGSTYKWHSHLETSRHRVANFLPEMRPGQSWTHWALCQQWPVSCISQWPAAWWSVGQSDKVGLEFIDQKA